MKVLQRTVGVVSGWQKALLVGLAGVGALACQADVPQQQDRVRSDRGAVIGWVEDAAGNKRAGAEVVLVSRTIPQRVDVGDADILRVVTDAQGRFRARCLRGRPYSVWAMWRDGVAGHGVAGHGVAGHSAAADRDVAAVTSRPWMTQILEGVVPGPPIALRAVKQWQPIALQFEGLDAWRPHGPIAIRAFAETTNAFSRPVDLDGSGQAQLPPMPGTVWDVEVRGRTGVLLRYQRVRRGARSTIAVSPPKRWSLRVQNATGQPVAGVEVLVAPFFSPGGRQPRMVPAPALMLAKAAGVDGLGTILLPAANPMRANRASQLLIVRAPGFADEFVAVEANAHGTLVAEKEPYSRVLTLSEGFAVTGRLLDGDGAPVADLPLFAEYGISLNGARGGRFPYPRAPVRTDAEGRFRIPGRSSQALLNIRLMLPLERAQQLGLAVKPGMAFAPVQWLRVVPPRPHDVDVGDLKLSGETVTMLTVVDHHEAPAENASVRVRHEANFQSMDFVTDRVGRLQLCVPDDVVTLFAWRRDGGIVVERVKRPRDLQLTLSEPLVLTGRVLDRDGKPVEGAIVRSSYGLKPRFGDPLWALVHMLATESEPTAADGRYRIVLPFADDDFRVCPWAVKDEKWWKGIAAQLPASGSVLDLEYIPH